MFTAFLKLLDIVPSWVYALVIGVALAWGATLHIRTAIAESRVKLITAERDVFAIELNSARVKSDNQKAEAAALLADLTGKAERNKIALQSQVAKLQKERNDAQAQNIIDVAAAKSGTGLRFSATKTDICGSGSASPASAKGATTSDAGSASTGVQLPERVPETVQVTLPKSIQDPVLDLLGKAQSILIDFAKLKGWAENPNLVCELRTAQ